MNCEYEKTQVGMFLWGRIPDKYKDAEELTEKKKKEKKKNITQGFIFGTNRSRYVRISLCAKDEKLKEALERIENMKL